MGRKPSSGLSTVAALCDDTSMGKTCSVNGPYPKGKWRVYLIDGSGRKSFLLGTRAEADVMKAALTARAQALIERTIGNTLDDYSRLIACGCEVCCRRRQTIIVVTCGRSAR